MYYRLPNREVTQDVNEYAQAWKELGDDIQAFLQLNGSNAIVMGFDPGVVLNDTREVNGKRVYDTIQSGASSHLSNDVALAIQKAYRTLKGIQ